MTKPRLKPLFVLMAVRLVQPGRLSDVLEGLSLIIPSQDLLLPEKDQLAHLLGELRNQDLVCLYSGQRYELTARGNAVLERAEIKEEVDVRRIFLLKASRRDNSRWRSDARDGSLKQ